MRRFLLAFERRYCMDNLTIRLTRADRARAQEIANACKCSVADVFRGLLRNAQPRTEKREVVVFGSSLDFGGDVERLADAGPTNRGNFQPA